ncbi:hypothetical protein DL93DRAFT_2141982 [Clavulina sp. PMI_390]|nr:hypothetical protein DL93DRAFT_2141982 [Clavulina sp. PMI_390]
MMFCPTCANMVIIGRNDLGANEWVCPSCPYKFPIEQPVSDRHKLKLKEIDEVLGTQKFRGDETDASCPKCDNGRALFYMLQIRSADEPMTRCAYLFLILDYFSLTHSCSIRDAQFTRERLLLSMRPLLLPC